VCSSRLKYLDLVQGYAADVVNVQGSLKRYLKPEGREMAADASRLTNYLLALSPVSLWFPSAESPQHPLCLIGHGRRAIDNASTSFYGSGISLETDTIRPSL
jgi:hypothetical protein